MVSPPSFCEERFVLTSLRKIIRVKKEESAFVYFIMEAQEGIVSYSTLPHQAGDPHRDLELRFSKDFQEEVEALMLRLGELVYEIRES